MEIGNNLRIFYSTTAFEHQKIIIVTITSNYALEKTKHISRKVVIETINIKEKNTRKALPYLPPRYTGQEILPVLQSWADQNEKQMYPTYHRYHRTSKNRKRRETTNNNYMRFHCEDGSSNRR